MKKIISQDKLDLLDFDHIIKENKYEKMSRGFDKCQTFFLKASLGKHFIGWLVKKASSGPTKIKTYIIVKPKS